MPDESVKPSECDHYPDTVDYDDDPTRIADGFQWFGRCLKCKARVFDYYFLDCDGPYLEEEGEK